MKPSPLVTLSNQKFLETLHRIVKCLQQYFRKFIYISSGNMVAAVPVGKTLASVAKMGNGQFTLLPQGKPGIVNSIVLRLLILKNVL